MKMGLSSLSGIGERRGFLYLSLSYRALLTPKAQLQLVERERIRYQLQDRV